MKIRASLRTHLDPVLLFKCTPSADGATAVAVVTVRQAMAAGMAPRLRQRRDHDGVAGRLRAGVRARSRLALDRPQLFGHVAAQVGKSLLVENAWYLRRSEYLEEN
jgi:hypothetical protein